jgi:hypothetical protein
MAQHMVVQPAQEQVTPARRLIAAPSSDPSFDEALARVRRIEALDEETRQAASHVRCPAMTS